MPFPGIRSRVHVLRVAAAISLLSGPNALSAQAVNLDRDGIALSGHDPVAYFVDNRPVMGSADLTATHDGATYHFASVANRDKFITEPGRYVPAYGGYCAFGVSRGYKVKVDPEAFRVVGGRLYLNYDKSVQQQWLKDVPGYIVRADENWGRIKDAPRK